MSIEQENVLDIPVNGKDEIAQRAIAVGVEVGQTFSVDNGKIIAGRPDFEETEEKADGDNAPKKPLPFPIGKNVSFTYRLQFDGCIVSYTVKAFTNASHILAKLSELQKTTQTFKNGILQETEESRAKEIANEEAATKFLFDEICVGGEILIEGQEPVALDKDSLLSEYKTPAIAEYASYSIRVVKAKDPIFCLYNKKTEIEFEVVAGGRENPRHTFYVTVRRPSDSDIKAFSTKFYRQESDYDSDNATLENWTDHDYGKRRFDEYFVCMRDVSVFVGDEQKDFVENTPRDKTDPVYLSIKESLCPFLKGDLYKRVIEHLQNPLGKPRRLDASKKSFMTTSPTKEKS